MSRKFVYFDIETTKRGKDAEIIQIGAVASCRYTHSVLYCIYELPCIAKQYFITVFFGCKRLANLIITDAWSFFVVYLGGSRTLVAGIEFQLHTT